MKTYAEVKDAMDHFSPLLLFCIVAWHAGLLTSREAALTSHYEESLFLKMAGRAKEVGLALWKIEKPLYEIFEKKQ
jgi:hypothetical protein